MLKFILRRLLQIIPIVLGAMTITFVLAYQVGRSPGMAALGEKASPQQIEDFNEHYGFNKPAIVGRTVPTLAHLDQDMAKSAGAWAQVSNATYVAADKAGGRGYLKCAAVPVPPLNFPLRQDTSYRWTATWRTPGGPWTETSIVAPPTGNALDLAPLFPGAGEEFHLAEMKLRRLVDHPFDSQIVHYFSHIARLDFGISTSANLPVIQLIKDGIRPTMTLAIPILVSEVIVGVSLGLLCAFFRGRLFDRAMVFVSVSLMSINYLVWIVVGQYLLAFKLGWFPIWGFESWAYLVLPVAIGTVSGFGADVRFYRTVMLDEVYKDYVRTAFAKGVSTRGVLFKHVLRNAMVPIVTNVMISIPFLYTGSLLLESYFGIPGIGYLSVNAVNSNDPYVIRAIVFFGSILYTLCGLASDLLAAFFDPRIKLS